MGSPVESDDINAGVWKRAKPTVVRRAAYRFNRAADDPEAPRLWDAFLLQELEHQNVMQLDLRKYDDWSGVLIQVSADVRTAADFAAELPVPQQGMPTFAATELLKVLMPERPMPLLREWLTRLPPQQCPPGFEPLPWTKVFRPWARRLVAQARNTNMAYDATCYVQGHAPSSTRSRSFTLGKGAAYDVPHLDGIGSYNLLDLLLERRASDGWLELMDFTKPERRTWLFEVIEGFLGTIDNQEIMSFLFHGVSWKIDAPRQVRVAKNLQRYDDKARAIDDAIRVLEKKSWLSLQPICKTTQPLSEDGPNPFIFTPQWDCPVGGLMKPDGSARIVGDMSDPHDGHRERNEPHGEPDGPIVVSFNDLSGPKGSPKEGYAGPMPFPEPETKPRPRHKYTALAVLNHYAQVNDTFVVSGDDDMEKMFFQFFVRDSELYLSTWYVVMMVDGALWLVAITARTMNMGSRTSSKIACNFAEEWLDAWRTQMDTVVKDWLPKQSKGMQDAYRDRLQKLGAHQARPFWAGVYTDNFDFTFCASELAARGMLIWRNMNIKAQIRMQEHIKYGTCIDWIGGRCVNNAGYGCITPSKKSRAIRACEQALAGTISREDYEANNSFLGHVNDICDWPPGSLQGITGPLKVPGHDLDMVRMTPQATAKYQKAIELLNTRAYASFWSGVADAYHDWQGKGAAEVPIRIHATDCCTDPQPYVGNPSPQPHIAGMVDGAFWRFKLTDEWLTRHITLTESCGPAISTLMTVPKYPSNINLLASDATSSTATTANKSKSDVLRTMQRTLQEEPIYDEAAPTIWVDHWKGWGMGIPDAISRDNLPMAIRIATAFGIKLHEIPIPQVVHRFMWRTLVRTRPLSPESFQIFVKGIDGASSTLHVDPTFTVDMVTEAYAVEQHMSPTAVMRALWKGKQLATDATMREVAIKPKDTIHIVSNLPGAGGLRDLSDPPSPIRPSRQNGTPPLPAQAGPSDQPQSTRGLRSLPASPQQPQRASPRKAAQRSAVLRDLPTL